MAWRIVQQPDGLFARFSDVVDAFTTYDMTYEVAIEECQRYPGMGILESREKVQRAIDAGNERWQDSLRLIRMVHGPDMLRRTVDAIIRKQYDRLL